MKTKYHPWVHYYIPPEFSHRNNKSYIYFLITDGVVVYIGRTSDINKRIAAHKSYPNRYDFLRVIECHPDKLDHYERRWIRKFSPKNNRMKYKMELTKSIF